MNNKVLSQESHEMTLAWHLSFLGRNIYPDGHSRLRMEESMAHRRIKRGISVVLILFMLVIYVNAPFGNGIRAFGDTVTDLNQAKDKQDQLSSQYEDTKKQLEQLQQESADTKSYIEQLDGKMSTLDSSLQSLNTQIEDMQNQIEEARVNLEQAEIDADVQYDSMKLRIQFMYERNEDTYLDILLSSSSLADLLNKADYITKISEYDRQKLQEYEETIQYIEQTKQNLESDYAELDTMKISLEDQKSALALVQQAKEQELAALSTQTTQTASTKAQLEKEMQEQENEILNLVAKKQQEDAAAKKPRKKRRIKTAARDRIAIVTVIAAVTAETVQHRQAVDLSGQRFQSVLHRRLVIRRIEVRRIRDWISVQSVLVLPVIRFMLQHQELLLLQNIVHLRAIILRLTMETDSVRFICIVRL